MDWGHIVSLFVTTIAGGGWFISYRLNKSDKRVDLTDKILQKYQSAVLCKMDDHTDAVKEHVTFLLQKVELICEYLGDDFAEFKRIKRDSTGRFAKTNKQPSNTMNPPLNG